jgi:hypothetical protein
MNSQLSKKGKKKKKKKAKKAAPVAIDINNLLMDLDEIADKESAMSK